MLQWIITTRKVNLEFGGNAKVQFMALQHKRPLPEIENLSVIFDGVKQDILSRGQEPKYPTNLKDLDRIIWGLHKKELFTLGARPSEGKTALAGQLAFNLADQGHNVLFISLEMSKEQIVERLFCNVTRTVNVTLREGQLDDNIAGRFEVFGTLVEQLPILVVDKCGYEFDGVEQLVTEMAPKPDIVILDYIQLISQGRYGSKVQAIEEYFRRLKELSVSQDCAIVVLSQIRRPEERRQNRRPTMDELKGSGALEEHSDTIALIYWVKHNEIEHKDANEFEVNIAKQRHGPIGLLKLNFFPQFYLFEDREEKHHYEEREVPF
jgi:replicative DNA helicase